MLIHFWLICGLWVGLGGALFGYFQAKPKIAVGDYVEDEVKRFLLSYALWIFVPSLLFWGLQLSANADPVDFLQWPTPQKEIALGVLFFVWGSLLIWTWAFSGAATLSKWLPLIGAWPNVLLQPTTIKTVVLLGVAIGIWSLTESLV
jgi:hypothetical protein